MDPRTRATEVPHPGDGQSPHEDAGLPPTGPPGAEPTDVPFEVATPVGEAGSRPSWPRGAREQIGSYELLEEVARGGMGVVYKARHTAMDRVVALKTMRAEALADAQQGQRFDREIRAAARLNHPNIVPIYEVGRHEGQPFYTMAYLPGGSLGDQRQRLLNEPRRAVVWMEQVARAVQYAHERGVLHRDLKPANVLLDERGQPHVSDFGLAKFQDADVDLTHTGAVLGTPAYMAPEQAAGRVREIGPATDVWALGVMLFELLTGRRPFVGESGDDVKRKIALEDPPRPRSLRPNLDRSLETIVLKCMEKEPAQRYRSAGALADDLGCYLRGEPIRVRPPGPAARAWRWLRRHRGTSTAAAVVVLTATALPVVSYYADHDRPIKEFGRCFDKGGDVTLVDEHGAYRWHRWHLNDGSLKPDPSGNGLTVASVDPALLELWPAPPRLGYRFRAEVKQYGSSVSGHADAGIYFGHSRHQQEDGVHDCYCALTFDDVDKTVRFDPVRQPLLWWRGRVGAALAFPMLDPLRALPALLIPPDEVAWGTRVQLLVGRTHEMNSGTITAGIQQTYCLEPSPPWREIVVEVFPDRVRVFWMKQLLGEVARADLVQKFKDSRRHDAEARWFKENPDWVKNNPGGSLVIPYQEDPGDMKPEFLPQDGLGLWVHGGTAMFRRVVVEPLGAWADP